MLCTHVQDGDVSAERVVDVRCHVGDHFIPFAFVHVYIPNFDVHRAQLEAMPRRDDVVAVHQRPAAHDLLGAVSPDRYGRLIR